MNLLIVDNVLSYQGTTQWEYTCLPTTEPPLAFYLIIDKQPDEAFGHWVFESAIYLSYFHLLCQEYPTLVLLLQGEKQYKTLFCNDFEIPFHSIEYEIKQPRNKCFFTPLHVLNTMEQYPLFVERVNALYERYHTPVCKTKELLFLPRQVKENYKPNDRVYETGELEKEILQQYGEESILKTDEMVELKKQIQLVSQSRMIVLTDGSPFLVNGMFARDSILLILGNTTPTQCDTYGKMHFLREKIKEKNTIIYLSLPDWTLEKISTFKTLFK